MTKNKNKIDEKEKNNRDSKDGEDKNGSGESDEVKKKKKNEGGKEPPPVVLKADIHCEGCASKLTKVARSFSGVQSVKAEMSSGKLTVVGEVDALQLRDFVAHKTKKKIDVISPLPKKNDTKNDDKNRGSNNEKNQEDSNEKKPKIVDTDKKPKEKEQPLTTSLIKMSLHCQGCIEKIKKIISKSKGVLEVSVDKQREIITVKGTMDARALAEVLKERLKRNAEVVPTKKEKEEGEKKKDGNNGGGKEVGSDSVGKGGGDSGGKQGSGGGGGKKGKNDGGETVTVGESRMDFMANPGKGSGNGLFGLGSGLPDPSAMGPVFYGPPSIPSFFPPPSSNSGVSPFPGGDTWQNAWHCPGPENGYGYPSSGYPAHMKFNDENPNACSVM